MTLRPTARTALAALLVEMAVGQLSDADGFARILASYRVIPHGFLVPVSWGVGAAELVTGALLWRDRRLGGRLAVVLVAGWTALALTAFTRRLVLDNCGCFGVFVPQPLRWWVLVEDAAFLALALHVAAGQQRGGRPLREQPAPTK